MKEGKRPPCAGADIFLDHAGIEFKRSVACDVPSCLLTDPATATPGTHGFGEFLFFLGIGEVASDGGKLYWKES